MNYIFEIVDKSEREIRLTKERWKHITTKHPYMSGYLAETKETIKDSQKVIPMIKATYLIIISITNIEREN